MNQKLNDYTGCQVLRTATGSSLQPRSGQTPLEFLEDIVNEGEVHLPCDFNKVFWIPERVPIYADTRKSVKSSFLLRGLYDRSEDTGLVVDSLISGKDAVHLIALVESEEEVARWVRGSNREHMAITIRSIDETMLVIATLRSYVFGPSS